ncbi:MAG: alpha/beta hydrolase [Opitutia bacterium]
MRALLLIPLVLTANPSDRDGDGWSDTEETAKGFLANDPRSHPPAPRYAPADLGAVAELGWPVALSDEKHRVLTERGFRWSWTSGWERLAQPPRAERVEFGVIRSDGAVLARVESSEEGMPTTSLWRWDASGVPALVPRTLHRYLPDADPAPWLMRPLRWLRGEGFLLAADPIVLEPGPLGVDILVGDATQGVPAPSRRHLSPSVIANGIGERWVADFQSPDGTWRLDGHARRLPDGVEPLAWSDDSALVHRRGGALQLDEPGAPVWQLPFSASVAKVALADAPGSLRSVVSLDASDALVWDIDSPDRETRPPELLVHLVDSDEGWTSLLPVAVDAAGTILAVGQRSGASLRIVLLVPCRVRADLPRRVDVSGLRSDFPLDDSGFTTSTRPLPLWLNDDRDEGGITPDPLADLPGQGADTRTNFRRDTLGGLSDLSDWFPVALHLGAAAEDLPPFDLRLLGPSHLVNAVETSLPIARAAQFLQRDFGPTHGPSLDTPISGAYKSRSSSGGLPLSPAFSRSVVGPRLLGRGEGVFLVEGAAAGTGTIWVTLVRQGTPVERVPGPADILLRAPLRVTVAPVGDFHRSWNARSRSPSLSPPPPLDSGARSTAPWLIFVHGFNVGPTQGLAWGAEIFKRLHQAGSASPFIAFRWYGDQGAANYGSAVECAPAAADRLCQLMSALAKTDPGRPFVLMGHSLGAYVTLLAAEPARAPKGVSIRACVLVNAAIPVEALDPSAPFAPADYPEGLGLPLRHLMSPPGTAWRDTSPYVLPQAQAAGWASNFPSDDLRSTCRWIGRFSAPVPVINLYSRSEDVLSPPPAEDSRWPGVLAVADHGAWIYQEATKGRWPGRWVNPVRSQAGWGLSPQASARASSLLRSGESAQVELLRKRPLFADYRDKTLLHPRVGPSAPGSRSVAKTSSVLRGIGSASLPSGARWTLRDELLAHAIPALSPAAGCLPVSGARNYRMDGSGPHDPPSADLPPFPLGWPTALEAVTYLDVPAPIWRHSDWRNVAYPYVHPAFALIVREAGLSEIPTTTP